ncbi:MAG: hypothetical protein U0271_10855 [Polyangiaceae bacterium]
MLDAEGRQLGPDAFVPGYTQVYVFEDGGRQNGNPNVAGLLFDGQTRTADETIEAGTCPISVEDRRKAGRSAPDEFAECTTLDVDVDVPDDVAGVDPDAFDTQGNQLSESVWVSYFSTGGDFQSQVKLVSDSAKGRVTSSTVWVPPDEPGLYRIWAVVRDNRGGSTTVSNLVEVTE